MLCQISHEKNTKKLVLPQAGAKWADGKEVSGLNTYDAIL